MEKKKKKNRPGYHFDFSLGGKEACLTKLFQFGEKTEAEERHELSVNQCKTTNLTGVVKLSDKRRQKEDLQNMWNWEVKPQQEQS